MFKSETVRIKFTEKVMLTSFQKSLICLKRQNGSDVLCAIFLLRSISVIVMVYSIAGPYSFSQQLLEQEGSSDIWWKETFKTVHYATVNISLINCSLQSQHTTISFFL